MNASLKQQLEELGLAEATVPSHEQWVSFLGKVAATYTATASTAAAGPDVVAPEQRPDEVATLLRNLREKSVAALQKNATALAESLALAHAVQESVADAIMVVGVGGRLLSMNGRFREMCQIPDELASSSAADAVLEHLKTIVKDPDQLRVLVRTSVDEPKAVYTNDIDLKDGRTFERYVAPVPTRDGTLYGRVICYRDVTERRRVERERLAAAEQMEAVKEIVARMQVALESQATNERLASAVRDLLAITAVGS